MGSHPPLGEGLIPIHAYGELWMARLSVLLIDDLPVRYAI
jgi:hypothetical protein